MSNLSKWSIFLRAFIVTLIAAHPTRVGAQSATEEQTWRSALESNTPQAYHDYLSQHPAGKFVREAVGALRRLGAIEGASPSRGLPGATGAAPY